MGDYQTALYGLFVIIAVGVIQYIINQFMNKKAELEKEKIDSILTKITELSSKFDTLILSLNKHDTEIALLKEKFEAMHEKLKTFEYLMKNHQ